MDGVTRESLRPLLDLQRIDSTTDRLTQRLGDLPEQRALDALQAERAEAESLNAERGIELDAVVREQTRLETDIAMVVDKIARETKRMDSGQVSSARELTNIAAELDSLRRRTSHLEDQELEVMEQREGLDAVVGELTATLSRLAVEIAEATVRRDEVSVEISKELDELASERTRVVPTLHPEVLELYEDVRARRGGVAVGALEGSTCTACNLPLSPMARDEIKRSTEPIVRCENCRRLLVVV